MPKKPTTKKSAPKTTPKSAPKAKAPSPMMMSKKQMGSMPAKGKKC